MTRVETRRHDISLELLGLGPDFSSLSCLEHVCTSSIIQDLPYMGFIYSRNLEKRRGSQDTCHDSMT